MNWQIERPNGVIVGPYPTWEAAEEDRKLLRLDHAKTVMVGKPSVKAR